MNAPYLISGFDFDDCGIFIKALIREIFAVVDTVVKKKIKNL